MKGIFVVGFMGAGKSTVGRALARRTRIPPHRNRASAASSLASRARRLRARWRRIHHPRPLARDPVAFAALYQTRRESYALADVHVPIESDDPELTVDAILARVNLP